ILVLVSFPTLRSSDLLAMTSDRSTYDYFAATKVVIDGEHIHTLITASVAVYSTSLIARTFHRNFAPEVRSCLYFNIRTICKTSRSEEHTSELQSRFDL